MIQIIFVFEPIPLIFVYGAHDTQAPYVFHGLLAQSLFDFKCCLIISCPFYLSFTSLLFCFTIISSFLSLLAFIYLSLLLLASFTCAEQGSKPPYLLFLFSKHHRVISFLHTLFDVKQAPSNASKLFLIVSSYSFHSFL